MINQCKKCSEELEAFNHKHNERDKRTTLLESFKIIKNDNRWMIIIFVAFVTICTYIYQTDIKNFMTIQNSDKVDFTKELNLFKLEIKDENKSKTENNEVEV